MRQRFSGPLARWACPAVAIVGAINGVWEPAPVLIAVAIYAWSIHRG